MSTSGTEAERITITICMGSSCFSRGNKITLQTIREYLNGKNLEAEIIFMGSHCMDLCDKGPVLKINKRLFQHVDPQTVSDLLDEELFH